MAAIFLFLATCSNGGDGGDTFELLCGQSRRRGCCGREEWSAKDFVDILVFSIAIVFVVIIVVVVFDVSIGVRTCPLTL